MNRPCGGSEEDRQPRPGGDDVAAALGPGEPEAGPGAEEQAVRGRGAACRALFDHSPDAILETDPAGRVFAVNPAACLLFGRTEAEIRQVGRAGLVDESDPNVPELVGMRADSARAFGVMTLLRRDGTSFPGEVTAAAFDDGSGLRISMMIRDASDRLELQKERRTHVRMLQEAARIGNLGYWEWDAGADRTTWSAEIFRMAGVQKGEHQLTMQTALDITHPDDSERVRRAFEEALAGEARYDLDFRVVRPDGEERWVHSQGDVERYPDGRPRRMFGVVQDITGRKREEEGLRASEERFRTLVDSSPLALLVYQEGKLAYANPVALRLAGATSEEEMIGTGIADRVPPKRLLEVMDRIRRTVAGETGLYPREERYLRLDGTEVPVEVTAAPCLFGGRPALQVIGMDLAEVKRAEAALRESQARFRGVFESSALGIAIMNTSEQIVDINPACCRILGYPEADVLGHSPVEFTHPEDRKATTDRLALIASGKTSGFAWEKRFVAKNGETVWARVTTAPIRDETGELGYTVALFEDIGDRKEMERDLRRSQDQLRALAARTESVREEERRGISRELHDVLGQALTALRMDLSQFGTEPPAAKDWRRRVKDLLATVDEDIDLIRELSSRLRPPILDVLGLAAAIEWQTDQFTRRGTLSYHTDLDSTPLDLGAEVEGVIFRIVQESLTNVQRHAHATEVRVRLRKAPAEVVVEVQDNGVGMPADALVRITSLGLIGMRERARAIGSRLTLEVPATGGTLVRLEVPRPNGAAGR